MEAMDGLVQQSVEMLQDVKKRQEAVHRSQEQRKQQGPLTQLLIQGTGSVPSAADIRCRGLQAVGAARQRTVSAERANINDNIHFAQDLAVRTQGRSRDNRMRTAQRIASRSASRNISSPQP